MQFNFNDLQQLVAFLNSDEFKKVKEPVFELIDECEQILDTVLPDALKALTVVSDATYKVRTGLRVPLNKHTKLSARIRRDKLQMYIDEGFERDEAMQFILADIQYTQNRVTEIANSTKKK